MSPLPAAGRSGATPSYGRQRVALGPGIRPLQLVAQDGVELVGAHYPALETDTALVLVHGFGGAHDQARVDRIARRWSSAGSSLGVVSVTMRGHGRSAGRTTVGHREPMDVEAAAAWARSAGYRRIVTVGFSMGAAVVLRHAALRPASDGFAGADAVVAVSGPAFWYYRGTPPMRWLHRGVSTPLGRAYLRRMLGAHVDPAAWPNPAPLEPVGAARAVDARGIPLLIVHGDRDAFFPLEHPCALRRAAPGAQLWIEPGFGHAEGAIGDELIDRLGAWAAASTSIRRHWAQQG